MNNAHGLILLHKPEGITSFHALDEIKKKLKIKKVGHTGTLDKFAQGLLLVLTGKYTRLTPFFSHLDKVYISKIRFGIQTDTLDPEGKIIKKGGIPDSEAICKTLSCFSGEIEQVPPRFSAIHMNGERVYKKALRGEEMKLPKRKVFIYNLKLLSYDPPFLTLHVHCSGGTYIRALARDIGTASGTCAYVTELTRTKVGNFKLSQAVFPSYYQPEKDTLPPTLFIPQLDGLEIVHIQNTYTSKVLHGVQISDYFFKKKPEREWKYAVFEDKKLIAIIEKKENNYKYLMLFGG